MDCWGRNSRLLRFGEEFERGINFECLLVVLNCLPLSTGTSFDFNTLADFVLLFGC
jgi:hypothetical protein